MCAKEQKGQVCVDLHYRTEHCTYPIETCPVELTDRVGTDLMCLAKKKKKKSSSSY